MTLSDVQRRIARHYDRLSPKQRQIARVIADNETFAAFASAGELGRAAGADAATVVRFAQALGFSGYAELQEVIRSELPTRLTFVQRLEQQLQQPVPPEQLPARVITKDIDNLQQTLAHLSPETLDAVVNLILEAEHVFVVGMGFSSAIAVFLAHGLNSLGIRTTAHTEGGPGLAMTLANLRTTDALVGVSVWRYLRETVEALAAAASKGVPTVALTDSTVSPLARIANHALIAATQGIAHSLSPVGLVAIVNILLAQVVAHDPERTLRALREIDRLYRDRGMVDGTSEWC